MSSSDLEILSDSIDRLEQYIQRENYRGYDPYDALLSPIFSLLLIRNTKLVRFGAQQVIRRLPFNIRPLMLIPKGYNPVTLGLCIQAYVAICKTYPEKKEEYIKKIDFCISELVLLQSKGYHGSCWGYDFDWEARYAKIPAFTPTVVATGFITNALFEYYTISKSHIAEQLILSSSEFVLHDLHRTYDDTGFCFSYSPHDQQIVFNATMKGARILAQAFSICGNEELIQEAKKTVNYVMESQKNDGSWSYSKGDTRTWIDNFHTAYVLDCLDEYMIHSKDESYNNYLSLGLEFYFQNFFELDGVAKYYHNNKYPIDSTSVAQSILTSIRFGNIENAQRVAQWVIKHMTDRKGHFYYRKHQFYTNKISYMRWSNAWIFAALTKLHQSLLSKNI